MLYSALLTSGAGASIRLGTGQSSFRSNSRTNRVSTIDTSLEAPFSQPARNSAIRSSGSTVALHPMRTNGCVVTSARRSSPSDRNTPRFVSAIEWISSTITQRTVASFSTNLGEFSRIASVSGVVLRMCGVFRSMAARSSVAVSPWRMACRISFSSPYSLLISLSGSPRFLWMSFASDLSGEM